MNMKSDPRKSLSMSICMHHIVNINTEKHTFNKGNDDEYTVTSITATDHYGKDHTISLFHAT